MTDCILYTVRSVQPDGSIAHSDDSVVHSDDSVVHSDDRLYTVHCQVCAT